MFCLKVQRPLLAIGRVQRRFVSAKTSDPLRILFCGSDEFSCASLNAVYQEHRRNPDLIESIDVVHRPGKPTGRWLKTRREVPIQKVAEAKGLPIHERDTFTGWTPPSHINLIVAVSFGLFVPPRILEAAKYGGLNVHPSLLPQYRGPAPLHYTLLSGETTTGVTLQTLDPKAFDHGLALAQKSLTIPNRGRCTVDALHDLVAAESANILVEGLRNRLFVPPIKDVSRPIKPHRLVHAPKITSADRRIDWRNWKPETIERRSRVLNRLWTEVKVTESLRAPKRLVFEDIEVVPFPKHLLRGDDSTFAVIEVVDVDGSVLKLPLVPERGDVIFFDPAGLKDNNLPGPTWKGNAIKVREMTVGGGKRTSANDALGGGGGGGGGWWFIPIPLGFDFF